MTVGTVVFDVGETIVEETRIWSQLAGRAGVSPLTLFAVLGSLIERGEDHRLVWERVGVEPPATDGLRFEGGDLYPDVLPCLAALRGEGRGLGIAGNQPAGVAERLAELELPVDFIGSSAAWGVSKPDAGFFARVCEEAGAAPGSVAYVGDRLDNDVLPAMRAGMVAVFILRGPWAVIHGRSADARRADIRIAGLAELPRALAVR
ncbi:MAG TPA: HAD family hydrolase [Solirubrobacteraceae bacterium]|nr:HAD family hydrolase [Solirubrobacteraceae bacterium]